MGSEGFPKSFKEIHSADLGAATADGRSCLPSAAVGKKGQKASVMPSARLSTVAVQLSLAHLNLGKEETTAVGIGWAAGKVQPETGRHFAYQAVAHSHLEDSLESPCTYQPPSKPFCTPSALTMPRPHWDHLHSSSNWGLLPVSSGSCESLFLLSG